MAAPATHAAPDPWAEWVLQVRASGVPRLVELRERLLDAAGVEEGTRVLDLGAGEGLVALGALDRGATVVLSDVSTRLLDHCEAQLQGSPLRERASFVVAAADDLSTFAGASFDVVTCRSVLIYLSDRAAALAEAFRVLAPGGRLSAFEPINAFELRRETPTFYGYDLGAAAELGHRVRARWERDSASLLDFDERDLLRWAADAGFASVKGTLEVELMQSSWLQAPWEEALATRPNPLALTFGQAIEDALDADERARFEAALRPEVEAGSAAWWQAGFFLLAEKAS